MATKNEDICFRYSLHILALFILPTHPAKIEYATSLSLNRRQSVCQMARFDSEKSVIRYPWLYKYAIILLKCKRSTAHKLLENEKNECCLNCVASISFLLLEDFQRRVVFRSTKNRYMSHKKPASKQTNKVVQSCWHFVGLICDGNLSVSI